MQQEKKKTVNSPDDLNFANSELSLSIIFLLLFMLGIRCDEKLVKWHRQPLHNVDFISIGD